MIFKDSRYTNTSVSYNDGIETFEKRKIPKFNLNNAIEHTVVEGETFDLVSNKYYGTPKYWWVILDANRETIPEYFSIVPGVKLKIPNYSDVKGLLRSE